MSAVFSCKCRRIAYWRPTETCSDSLYSGMSRGLNPKIKPGANTYTRFLRVVRRRQVRIGRRGRIVTIEVRQARIGTIVSIAGTNRRTEARNLPSKEQKPT